MMLSQGAGVFPNQFNYLTTKEDFAAFVRGKPKERILLFLNPDCIHCVHLYHKIILNGGLNFKGVVGFIRSWEKEKQQTILNGWLSEQNLPTLPLAFPHSLYLNCVDQKCSKLTLAEFEERFLKSS